jgi:hypothetical protein
VTNFARPAAFFHLLTITGLILPDFDARSPESENVRTNCGCALLGLRCDKLYCDGLSVLDGCMVGRVRDAGCVEDGDVSIESGVLDCFYLLFILNIVYKMCLGREG